MCIRLFIELIRKCAAGSTPSFCSLSPFPSRATHHFIFGITELCDAYDDFGAYWVDLGLESQLFLLFLLDLLLPFLPFIF